MTSTSERHGHYLGYVTDKCRCPNCREAWRLYQAKRSRDIAYRGRAVKQRTTPNRAAQHIHNLRERGIGSRTIQAATGISASTVEKIAAGERTWISAETERAILGYATPPLDTLTDRARLEGVGTHRRIRALQALGWSLTDLADRLGCTGSNLGEILRYDRVRAKTARTIEALYAELWDKTPPPSARRTKTLNLARLHGWPPPMAWDDIDDPDATPNVGEEFRRATGGTGRPVEDLVEDITWLLRHDGTLTAAQLAERLGYSDRSGVQNALARHGYRELLDRLNRNADRSAA